MFESANLKIDRATEHISALSEFFQKHKPFTYVLETDTAAGRRSTYAKRNEAAINQGAAIIGDAVHNIRTALDHAYWEIVSPFARTPREIKAIQFPFSETAEGLKESLKRKLADRVSPEFFATIQGLNPHGGHGGDRLLYMIHELDILDKHRLLISTGDYRNLSSDIIRTQVPDFPPYIQATNIRISSVGKDFAWPLDPALVLARGMFGRMKLEEELEIPVEIIFLTETFENRLPVIRTLETLVDKGKCVLKLLSTYRQGSVA